MGLKTVLDYFRSQPSASDLTLKDLSLKVTFLLSLLSGQRCQKIHLLRIDHMEKSETKHVFLIYHIKPLEFIRYSSDEKLCVVTHLKEYINRISKLEILANNCSLATLDLTDQLRRVQYLDNANPFSIELE